MSEPQNNPHSGGTFPLPNALIDDWMPKLKDTELRLLLVVLRQTVGRRDLKTGRSKQRDWLTQSQLKKRTGRASEAVSAAIDAQVKQGLLKVEDESGKPLGSPELRRRHLSKLYFRPGHPLTAYVHGKTEDRNANTTTNNGYKNQEFRRVRKAESRPETSSKELFTREQRKCIEAEKEKIRKRLRSI